MQFIQKVVPSSHFNYFNQLHSKKTPNSRQEDSIQAHYIKNKCLLCRWWNNMRSKKLQLPQHEIKGFFTNSSEEYKKLRGIQKKIEKISNLFASYGNKQCFIIMTNRFYSTRFLSRHLNKYLLTFIAPSIIDFLFFITFMLFTSSSLLFLISNFSFELI